MLFHGVGFVAAAAGLEVARGALALTCEPTRGLAAIGVALDWRAKSFVAITRNQAVQ